MSQENVFCLLIKCSKSVPLRTYSPTRFLRSFNANLIALPPRCFCPGTQELSLVSPSTALISPIVWPEAMNPVPPVPRIQTGVCSGTVPGFKRQVQSIVTSLLSAGIFSCHFHISGLQRTSNPNLSLAILTPNQPPVLSNRFG